MATEAYAVSTLRIDFNLPEVQLTNHPYNVIEDSKFTVKLT